MFQAQLQFQTIMLGLFHDLDINKHSQKEGGNFICVLHVTVLPTHGLCASPSHLSVRINQGPRTYSYNADKSKRLREEILFMEPLQARAWHEVICQKKKKTCLITCINIQVLKS